MKLWKNTINKSNTCHGTNLFESHLTKIEQEKNTSDFISSTARFRAFYSY